MYFVYIEDGILNRRFYSIRKSVYLYFSRSLASKSSTDSHSECFLQVSNKVCADKGDKILKLFLGGPFSVTQGHRFCQGMFSPEGLNLHLFPKTRQLWTRHILLVVESESKEKTEYHVHIFYSWCFLERQHESVV